MAEQPELTHLGLNLAFLSPGRTGGMEVYARELVPQLRALRPELRITAFVNSGAHGELASERWLEGVELARLRHGAGRVGWVLNEQLQLPRVARRAGVDLLHSLASTAPAWGAAASVVTVNDLIYRRHPEAHGRLRATGLRVLVPLGLRHARRVIAISQATASDLVELTGVNRSRIDVVHDGAGATPADEVTPEPQLRERLGLGDRPIVLCVSPRLPHKNVVRLVDALASIESSERPQLVLPGYASDRDCDLELHARDLGMDASIRLPGWVSQADLEGLYAAAACFVFPSLYEGFGLPVLEAMRRGLAVTCSDRGSLREIAGDAALLFDPEDTGAIAGAVVQLLGDQALRDRLIDRGRERAASFSWERCARETLATYDRALV